jgi:uncharacterized membrane protein YhaH (DUF805 family)
MEKLNFVHINDRYFSRVELAEQISTFVFGAGLILIGCFKGASGPNRFNDEQV